MAGWLAQAYAAVLFVRDGAPVCYALRTEPDHVYLRQFFVSRTCRRTGVGRAAMQWLRHNVWSDSRRIRVKVLLGNPAAIAFWRSVGFSDYSLTMETNADGAPAVRPRLRDGSPAAASPGEGRPGGALSRLRVRLPRHPRPLSRVRHGVRTGAHVRQSQRYASAL